KITRAAELSGWAIALFDVPIVYLLQRSSFEHTPNPGAAAGVTIAIFGVFVVISLLTLDPRQVAATAVSGSVLGVLLQTEAGVSALGRLPTPLVLALTGAAGYVLYGRLIDVMRRLLDDARHRKQLEAHLQHADRMA